MNKIILILAVLSFSAVQLWAQEEVPTEIPGKKVKKDWSKVTLGDRANDHFMIQMGTESWLGLSDTVSSSRFGRHLNIYLMLDKPFKTDPRFSVGMGVGIGSSNIFFKNHILDIKGSANPSRATFLSTEGREGFKKFKMNTTWAEVPIELRFVAKPLKSDKSWKAAIGVKIGTMISAGTKGKDLQNANGNSIFGNRYIVKEKDRKFMNGTRFAGTARVGIGNFTIYSAVQITGLFKEGQGPDVRPFSLGICLAGL